jgi:hypothetical protein
MEQTRRVFIGSAAALGSAAVGSTLLFTSSDGHVHAAQRGADDPVSRALRTQMQEAVKALHSSARPGEAARKLASTLRLVVAHGTATGLDASLKATLRAQIRSRGRDAVLLSEIPEAKLAVELREFGVPAPPRGPIDYAARNRALNDLQANGLTPRLLAAAAFFDSVSEQLDGAAILRPVALRKDSVNCADIAAVKNGLSDYMGIVCAFAWMGPAAADLCFAAAGAYGGAYAAYLLICG